MNNWFSISGGWLSTFCTSSIWCTLPGALGFWPTLKGPWQAKRAATGRHLYGHSWCHSPRAVSSSFTHYLCLSKSYIIFKAIYDYYILSLIPFVFASSFSLTLLFLLCTSSSFPDLSNRKQSVPRLNTYVILLLLLKYACSSISFVCFHCLFLIALLNCRLLTDKHFVLLILKFLFW